MYLDIEFATRIMGSLPQSEIVRKGSFKIHSRCPVCGDSLKDKFKKRFWIFESKKGDHYIANCLNCGYSKPFSAFLKEYFPEEYREYLMESFKDRKSFGQTHVEEKKEEKKFIPELQFCERLDTLPENHPIVKYVRGRHIPREKYDRLWFTCDWPKLVNSVNPGTYLNEDPEPRLVIPIFDSKGKIESFQGRALRDDARAKYMTIKACEDSTKVYGQDTIDPLKTVYLLEGPLDSLFVDNAGAITGGQLALSDVPYKNMRVWVLDNEARHPDTTHRLNSLIEAGEKVVMWDNCPWPSKDINEMIKEDGATKLEIMNYLKDNTVSGLAAKLRFKSWNKSPKKK